MMTMTIATAPWPTYPPDLINYDSVTAIPDLWPIAIAKFGDVLALHDPHSTPEVKVTFRELYAQIQQFAAGMQALGIVPGGSEDDDPQRVAIFADNGPRWMVADQGTMMAGAANVVRSSKADRDELLYMLDHSGSIGAIVEDLATLRKLEDDAESEFKFDPQLWVVLLSDETPPSEPDRPRKILNFSQLMALGHGQTPTPHQHDRTTLATLIYTSGTTGKPKGAMLTHGNLMQQISSFGAIIPIAVGDKALCILPTWHAYERTCEYYLLSQGSTQIYTSIRYFKTDLTTFKPQATIGVPRLWESLYEGVQKSFRAKSAKQQTLINFFLTLSQTYLEARNLSQGLTLEATPPSLATILTAKLTATALAPLHALGDKLVYGKVRAATGGNIKFFVSGGGSLARHIDHFFAIVGINLLVGYGLTETAPVLAVRRIEANIPGASGPPIRDTELKIIDLETRKTLPRGDRGLVLARGPQIMRGYFRNPEATAKAIDGDGWFDTGDLGCLNHNNHIILTGRAKDTIVLSNGENIEPQPIEDACLRSPYIDQIMLVGQDQKQLGALIVPNFEAILIDAEAAGIAVKPDQTPPIALDTPELIKLLRRELDREVRDRPGFRADDRIGPIRVIAENFSIENGQMTQTLKIKRPVVTDRYHELIEAMFR
ncbi:MAG: long-chain fatty acid--CoA ligase [Coleofasciculaceae cyanobacterium RL_1_1]|nr:long-chain fatty acid--CoA ligase [Coleofasciculaceae cyanobacterium RL_1_1]